MYTYVKTYQIVYICIFLAALRLGCCVRAFSSCGEQGLLFVAVRGLLMRWLLLLQSTGSRRSASVVAARGPAGSVVVAHGLSCSAACGIFLDQG